jgi:hypothetical protein
MGKKVEERLAFTLIRPRHAINAFTPVAGSSGTPQERLYRLHFFIFVFHSKGKLNGNAQMPPLLAPLPSRHVHVHDDTFNKPPQPCIVASVLWDARVAK